MHVICKTASILFRPQYVNYLFQFQVQQQMHEPQQDLNDTNHNDTEDDIDAALTDLQVSLEGSSVSSPGDITHVPELQGYLRFFK